MHHVTVTMKLSEIPATKLDEVLQAMYGGAPPPCPAPRAFTPDDDVDALAFRTISVRPGTLLEPPGMLLIDLPADVLSEVYARIQLPCALK